MAHSTKERKTGTRRIAFFVICALAIVASSGAALIISTFYNTYIKNDYETTLENVTELIERELPILRDDPDEVLRLLEEDDERYWEMQETLTNIQQAMDVQYTYVLQQKDEGEWYYLISSLYARGTPAAEIHDLYYGENRYLEAAYENREMMVSEAPVTDKWGAYISGYRPVTRDGVVMAMVGADYDISYVRGLHAEVQICLIISLAAAMLLGILFALLARGIIIDLEKTVSERTKELQVQTEIAQNASNAKSRFLASMSHEIRTPMNAIIGMSTLMRTDNLDDLQRRYFGDMKKMAHSLMDIINDILDISKIEADKMELAPGDFNLAELYNQVCSTAQFSAASKSLLFKCSFDDDVPHIVVGDETRIRQIFMNLTGNAVKYTHEGFVALNISRARLAGRDYILISVSDSGIGIKQEDIPQLFEDFQQLDKAKNKGIEGTGLGLAITKRLVDMMNGSIVVESVYGEGSTFRVYLPLVEGDSSKIERACAGSQIKALPGVKALVVDDNNINLTVALGFLQMHNIEADTAESGEEAVNMLKETPYNIVFMDHMMPDMDGCETAEAIRNLPEPWCKNVPIIALSANVQSSARMLFVQSGMNDFIPKPIDDKDINRVLGQWLPPQLVRTETQPANPSGVKNAPEASGKSLDKIFAALSGIAGLDTAAGLSHVGQNRAAYIGILRQFCAEAPKYAGEIRKFLEEENWNEYRVRVHALKSVFASIGIEESSAHARLLEEAAADGDYTLCRVKNEPLARKVLETKDKLSAVLGESGSGTQPKQKMLMGLKTFRSKVETLMSACSAGKSEEADKTAAELSHISISGALPGVAGGAASTNKINSLLKEMTSLTFSMDYSIVVEKGRQILKILG